MSRLTEYARALIGRVDASPSSLWAGSVTMPQIKRKRVKNATPGLNSGIANVSFNGEHRYKVAN